MRSLVFALAVANLIACGQEIVTPKCDDAAHNNNPDASTQPDAQGQDSAAQDSGQSPDVNPGQDAAGQDAAGGPDANMMGGCSGNIPYCITALVPSAERVSVGESMTFTPTIDNAGAIPLTFTVNEAEVIGERRPGLPAVVTSQINFSLQAAMNGTVTFTVLDVPVHFSTTTFIVRLHAQGGGHGDVFAEGRVSVRGNVVFGGSSQVYAVSSDGRAARASTLTNGKLLEGSSFVRSPGNLLMARNGELIVYDRGATPERLKRFELSGENVGLGDFAYEDAMQVPYILDGQDATGLTQLMDGRIALAVYDFSRTPDSAIVIWNEDGTYDRTLEATNVNVRWQGLTASTTANELIVIEQASSGRLIRIDPMSGLELGVIATDIVTGWGALAVPGGNVYVGITAAVLRVTPQGGKTMISMLDTQSFDYWQFFTLFDGRVLAARDYSSDYANIEIIDGTMFTGYLRPMNAGGAAPVPLGLAYLD